MHGKQPRQVSIYRQSCHVCRGIHRLRPGFVEPARRHDVAPEPCELAGTRHDRVESLSRSATMGQARVHHLILDAMVSDFLWSLAVVRLVGLLHDPISGAAQGLVSWSRLIGCNPWTPMRCLRSARAITFERRRCVALVPLFPSSLLRNPKTSSTSLSSWSLSILDAEYSCLSCSYCRLYVLMPKIPVTRRARLALQSHGTGLSLKKIRPEWATRFPPPPEAS
jgi:hypothetical protein